MLSKRKRLSSENDEKKYSMSMVSGEDPKEDRITDQIVIKKECNDTFEIDGNTKISPSAKIDCGFIRHTKDCTNFTLSCLHCFKEYPIHKWQEFIVHIKENHTNANAEMVNQSDDYVNLMQEIQKPALEIYDVNGEEILKIKKEKEEQEEEEEEEKEEEYEEEEESIVDNKDESNDSCDIPEEQEFIDNQTMKSTDKTDSSNNYINSEAQKPKNTDISKTCPTIQSEKIIDKESAPTLSDLLKVIKENNRKQKQHEKNCLSIFSHLTQDIISLRSEVRLFQSPNFVDQMQQLPQLPLNCEMELQNFEKKLNCDESMRAILKNYLMKIGSDDLPYFLRRAVKNILTDELAMKYSWRGTNNKRRIQHFFIIKLIKDICMEKFPTSDEKRICAVLQQHFVHAKDRIQKRKLRTVIE